jgi:site-specific recombinase XerC
MTIRRSTDLGAALAPAFDTRDLFNQSLADWAEDPRTTFDAWLAARNFRGSSADVYRAQFHHFLDWLAERGKTLVHAEPALIDAFVATLDVKRQQRARYLRIMERVFDDMFNNAPAGGNPARPVARAIDAPWTDTRSNAPTGFLTPAQCTSLWEAFDLLHADRSTAQNADPLKHLQMDQVGQTAPGATPSKTRAVLPMHWRDQRDRALGAVLLGAGLKLSEAENLQLDAVDLAQKQLTAVAEDPRYTRHVPMDTRLTGILAHWLRTREETAIEGNLVFPAGRSGHAMHKATALRAIDTIVASARLRDAGIPNTDATTAAGPAAAIAFEREVEVNTKRITASVAPRNTDRISPQTLRNAYAATLFESDASDELVAERLGFAQLLSAKRLRAAWHDWQRAKAHAAAIKQEVARANARASSASTQ